ncbi:hypothetical protein D3C80_924760 [compost metagenome]
MIPGAARNAPPQLHFELRSPPCSIILLPGLRATFTDRHRGKRRHQALGSPGHALIQPTS